MITNTKRLSIVFFIALALPLLLVQLVLASGGDSEVRGLIESRPVGSDLGEWVIQGVTLTVDATTSINTEDGPLDIGQCAEASYTAVAGTPVAIELQSKLAADCNDDGNGDDGNEISGIIDAFPADLIGEWIVDGISYTTDVSTTFVTANGPFAVGACVEIEQHSNATTAQKIKTDDNCDGSGNGGQDGGGNTDVRQRVYGTVSAFPADLIGDWVVNALTYTASANTEFNQDDGVFAVGSCVKVDFVTATAAAIEIETADAHHCGANGDGGHNGDDLDRYGRVDSFPADLIGAWVIDGDQYQTGATTIFSEDDGAFAVGACVEVKYLPATNVALKIETANDYHCGVGDVPGSFQIIVGNIITFPTDFMGDWVVDGITVTADTTTQFKQDDGPFAVDSCVSVKFQTSNNLAIEIESEDPFDCGDSVVPPADEPETLGVNYSDGAAGSRFVFSADNFTPNSLVSIKIDGTVVGEAMTNDSGWATFAVQAGNGGRAATANISVVVNGVASNAQTITTSGAAPQRALPANYSAPVLNTVAAPTAVGLGTTAAFSTSQVALLIVVTLLLTLSLGMIIERD